MNAEIAQRLLALNQQFYTDFGTSFSATRNRLQPGVRRIVESLKGDETILDLGCGNGELARALAKNGHRAAYLGLDFSLPLLSEAESYPYTFPATFRRVDLTQWAEGGWQLSVISEQLSVSSERLPVSSEQSAVNSERLFGTSHWSLIVAFAVFHHFPGQSLRLGILHAVRQLLTPGGRFVLSNWQFLNSPRLRGRIHPWSEIGLKQEDVDAGDYLLDWRANGRGLRYVHHFDEKELTGLAASSGFKIIETFYSDGKEGNLAVYQTWEKA